MPNLNCGVKLCFNGHHSAGHDCSDAGLKKLRAEVFGHEDMVEIETNEDSRTLWAIAAEMAQARVDLVTAHRKFEAVYREMHAL